MAIPSTPIVFGLYDCKVARMTGQDPDTYGPWVDVPGIRKLEVKLNINDLEKIRGDNTDLAIVGGEVSSASFSAESASLAVEALNVVLPSSVSSSGSSYKQIVFDGDEAPGYFKLAGKARLDGGGSALVTLFKCRLSDCSFELSDNAAVFPSFGGEAVGNEDGAIFAIDIYDSEHEIGS